MTQQKSINRLELLKMLTNQPTDLFTDDNSQLIHDGGLVGGDGSLALINQVHEGIVSSSRLSQRV